MYAEERQHAIADLVLRRGRVSVAEVASSFGVTTETVRRDLRHLEGAGHIRRVHGGAVRTGAALETRLSERDEAHAEEKERIGRAAATLVPPLESTLLLDAGSTVGRVADHLPADRRLVVFTHSLTVASRLGSQASLELHLLPGRVRPTTQAAVGAETVDALSRLRADIAFVGVNGLSPQHGLSTPDTEEAAAKRAIVTAAQQVVVVADASKLGEDHTVRFADLDQIDTLVTDDRIRDADVTALERLGVEVVVG